MTHTPKRTAAPAKKDAPTLAQLLRQNLLKRKQQQRERSTAALQPNTRTTP